MNTGNFLTQRMDVSILLFLWKWKVATTSGLAHIFFRHLSMNAAYLRLRRLRRAGLVQTRKDPAAPHCYWVLTKKGFLAIKDRLLPLESEGFQSENPGHDLLVSAIHLGEWLPDAPSSRALFSEQELRCVAPEFYPDWIPRDLTHRPDGYWQVFPEGDTAVALEVELSQKREADYEGIGREYEASTKVHRVLWVVATPALGSKIYSVIAAATDEITKHNFIRLSDVYKHSWDATVFLGPDVDKSISQLVENCPTSERQALFMRWSLDTRNSPHKSRHYSFFVPSQLSDCTGFIPSSWTEQPNQASSPTVSTSKRGRIITKKGTNEHTFHQ